MRCYDMVALCTCRFLICYSCFALLFNLLSIRSGSSQVRSCCLLANCWEKKKWLCRCAFVLLLASFTRWCFITPSIAFGGSVWKAFRAVSSAFARHFAEGPIKPPTVRGHKWLGFGTNFYFFCVVCSRRATQQANPMHLSSMPSL